ncbi:1-acyl-sn-glycerol-3-phosphate acyltransferase [Planktotalea arctica]|uniref:1-acyl-sn-glycerol-3-phosphate acyltransferase n=1 Tax=Planktotalea arctica TaxID=1481893 RepID=UPI000A16DFE0|nr:1-acyl-sn-glycerol-3-phosphate acyltransferase [Planktotalea arctica]
MMQTVELPIWLFVLILLFAVVTFASHFLFPSVRWFFRRRMERVVKRVNERLERPIEPFKLARRYDMIQRLIYDPEVSQAIADHAKRNGVPENVAFEQARRYAREIVPSFSATAYFGFAIRIARGLSNALYRVRLGYHDGAGLSGLDKDATVVFVINHRSNMDYVLVTYLAAERSALAYAVGEWARVWPLSRLIKAMGAYFIRRKSRGDLYRRVLARYVHLATQAGVTQAMFPEGGLSLDGKLAKPKLGLLKYIADGYQEGGRDVLFVPVALNYDRVLEDRILMEANASGTRRFRARISVIAGFFMKQIWLRMTGRFHRFGYAAVSFGRPVSLRAHAETLGVPDAEHLADELMERIAEVVPVVPVPLLASVMLEQPVVLKSELAVLMQGLIARMNTAYVHMPRDDLGYAAEIALKHLCERRILRVEGDKVLADEDQRPALTYYANSIVHLIK